MYSTLLVIMNSTIINNRVYFLASILKLPITVNMSTVECAVFAR